MLPQRPANPEDQVVAGLVGEQQRRSRLEKLCGILDAANVHTKIVGNGGDYNPPRS